MRLPPGGRPAQGAGRVGSRGAPRRAGAPRPSRRRRHRGARSRVPLSARRRAGARRRRRGRPQGCGARDRRAKREREVHTRDAARWTDTRGARGDSRVRRGTLALVASRSRTTHRHGLPGSGAPARLVAGGRRAARRSACDRPGGRPDQRACGRASRAARPREARGRESLHALRWREAAALGRDCARHITRCAGARRADLRSRPPHVRRAPPPSVRIPRPGRRDRVRQPRRALRGCVRRQASPASRRSCGMRLLEPLTPDPGAPLAQAHPLAKIGAAFVLMLALFITVDPVTPALVLVAVFVAVPAIGVPPRALLRRAAPVFIAAVGIGFFNPVVNRRVAAGVAIAIRLVGISLAGIVAVASIDPTELADAPIQHLHTPRRFVVGALAAFRLMPLFADEWETIAMARLAPGVDDQLAPAARHSCFFALTRSLLVAAIRRATRLAISLDGRGFADAGRRTLARPRPIVARDWILVGASLGVAVIATVASIAAGSWRFFLAH